MVTKMSIAGSQIDASYQSWSKWKWLQQTLCVTDKVKPAFVKENEKKKQKKNKKQKIKKERNLNLYNPWDIWMNFYAD